MIRRYIPIKIGCIVVSSICFLIIFLLALTKEYAVSLPHGYIIGRFGVGMVWLAGPESDYGRRIMIIEPNIDSYAVCRNVLVGHRSPVAVSGHPLGTNKDSYFIVVMNTRKVYKGLTKAEWLRLLRAYGISENVELRKPPSRIDWLLHRY